MNKTLTLLAVVLATAATSFAGQSSKKVVVAPQQDLFRAGEVQLDVFAAGAAGNYNGGSVNGFGGGLGLSYFFTKYFGLGIDNTLTSLNGNGHVYNSTQADIIARYPIESWHLAPYALVGGGATWGTQSQGNGNVGGGLEYRINRGIGLFADSRYIYGNNGLNETLTRAGLRFIF
ncbi:MAG: hypothetical protein WAN16_03975 [Chthoniobacterales bacterium]|jgi:hypothetical protein